MKSKSSYKFPSRALSIRTPHGLCSTFWTVKSEKGYGKYFWPEIDDAKKEKRSRMAQFSTCSAERAYNEREGKLHRNHGLKSMWLLAIIKKKLESEKMNTNAKSISKGAEWHNFQLHSTFQ